MTDNTSPIQSQTTQTSTVSTSTNTVSAAPLQPIQPKRKLPLQYIVGALLLLLVLLGGIVGFYLMNQNQDVRQQASVDDPYCTGDKFPTKASCENVHSSCVMKDTTTGCWVEDNLETGGPGSQCWPASTCVAISSFQKRWCGADQKLTAINCSTPSNCSDGTPNGGCNINTQERCVAGALHKDISCPTRLDNGSCYYQGVARAPGKKFCTTSDLKKVLVCSADSNPQDNNAIYVFKQCANDEQCVGGSGTEDARCVKTSTVTNQTNSNNVSEGYVNNCSGTVCNSTGTQCVAVHDCASLDENGHCVEQNPEIIQGTVDAQQKANQMCRCIQADILTGNNGSCVNGHINTNAAGEPIWTNLIGSATVCPNNGCGGGSPTPTPLPSVCGDSCNINSDCPNNHQCSNNKCVLNACMVNNAKCSADKCTEDTTVTTLTCGAACGAAGTQCPNGHTCNTGTCKLNACLVAGASCNATKCATTTQPLVCGSTCTVGGTACPTNHTCNAGTCKLNACLATGAICDTTKCIQGDPIAACLNITASKTTGIVVGNELTFTCGTVNGVTSYKFEVRMPNGTVQAVNPLTASGNVSQALTVTQAGAHQARCAVCQGTTCSEWEDWQN